MSDVSGLIIRKKKGKTISKTKIASKKVKNKKHLISAAKSAEFVSKVRALAKRYHIVIQNMKLR